MAYKSSDIQRRIEAAPKSPTGVYGATIELFPGEYELDEPVVIDRKVRIAGDDTRVRLGAGTTTGFVVETAATGSRIERLWFRGSDLSMNYPAAGGVGVEVRAGRVIVEDCVFDYCGTAVLVNGHAPYNSDGVMLRDLEIQNSHRGIRIEGGEASTGSVVNCRIQAREVIYEGSRFGNHYVSNYLVANGDAGSFAVRVSDAQMSNGSTFTSTYVEAGSACETQLCQVILGGNMASPGQRISYGHSSLVFGGGSGNPNDELFIGGPNPTGHARPIVLRRNPPDGTWAEVPFGLRFDPQAGPLTPQGTPRGAWGWGNHLQP